MNLKSKMSRVLALSFLVGGLTARAADYTWSNAETGTKSWADRANWSSGGAAATDLPTNAADTVTFPSVDSQRRQVDLVKGSGAALSVATLVGTPAWRLCLPSNTGTYGGQTTEYAFGDVNGFAGEWLATGSKKTLVLTAASGVQTLPLVETRQQFSVRVENAATTADILQLRGTAGAVRKTGPGGLRIRDVAEPGDRVLELEEGDVQVDGVPVSPDAATAVCAKAALHLDASASATWEAGSYVDDDGRLRVTQWADVRGTAAGAEVWDNSGDKTASHVKDVQPPFVSASRSSTGLTLLDFGARSAANVGTYGPQALMRLKTRIDAAQEVFYVAALNDGTQVVGDASDYSLNASEMYVFTYGDVLLKDGGFARFNGNRGWNDVKTVNGLDRMLRTFDSYTASARDLMLTNVRLGEGNAKPVCYLASDRLYATNSGGVKIGEVLIFTAALTDDERTAVTDYLMRKWFAAAGHDDFALVNAADGTSLTVPAGRVARIGTLRVNGTTFTKKGAGTLQVGRVYPEDLTIAVEGGAVKINTQVATDAAVTAPVGTPQAWLDADADNAFETDGADVTAWNDRRGNGLNATRLDFDQITALPHADTTTLAGHTVLTFPDNAAFQLSQGGQRETFVVFSFPDDVTHYNAIGNGYTTDREGALFAADHCMADALGGGLYSVDGKPVRPSEATGSTFVAGRWHVAHLATTVAFDLVRLASNGSRKCTGRVSLGEIVTYTTALTPAERRQNIDYLMTKWTGQRHPDCAAPSKNVTVAFTGDATVASDTDATYADVAGSGTLTKTGSGAATVAAELAEGFTGIAVEGGTLTVTKPAAPKDRAQFHFDAMDAASYAAGASVDADGETRVGTWQDTRRNGVVARTKPVVETLYVTNPVVRSVACPDGETRPVFDFLEQTSRGVQPPRAAALSVDPKPAPSREAICVFADNVKDTGVIDVFGTTDSNVTTFKRGLKGTLFREDLAATDVRNGYIWVDGATGSAASYVSGEPNALHVVHIAPANGTAYNMGALGFQGSNYAGGQRYGEYLAFAEPLTDKERAWWQTHLLHKWLGVGAAAVWTNALDRISLARGATLAVVGDGVLAVPSLTGGGTLNATHVTGVTELVLSAPDGATVDGLTVNGTLAFADAVTVSLVGGERLKPGRYALVTATALENADVSRWTLATSLKRPWTLRRVGNVIYLDVRAPGLCVIIR